MRTVPVAVLGVVVVVVSCGAVAVAVFGVAGLLVALSCCALTVPMDSAPANKPAAASLEAIYIHPP